MLEYILHSIVQHEMHQCTSMQGSINVEYRSTSMKEYINVGVQKYWSISIWELASM